MRDDGGQKTEERGISNIEQGMTNYEGKKEVNGYQVNRKSGGSAVRRPIELSRQKVIRQKKRTGSILSCQPFGQM